MYVQTGKTFITTMIAVVLALGGLTMLSSNHTKEPVTLAETSPTPAASSSAPTTATQPDSSSYSSSTNPTGTNQTAAGYDDGYRAGYRDGHSDCSTRASVSRSGSYVRRTSYARHYAPRTRVAGVRYVAQRRGHSTRNMILRIAAPAAIGAGIGGIAGGGKGAGIGALIGGGGGALYHLIKHGRD
jgi:hypothetical protein